MRLPLQRITGLLVAAMATACACMVLRAQTHDVRIDTVKAAALIAFPQVQLAGQSDVQVGAMLDIDTVGRVVSVHTWGAAGGACEQAVAALENQVVAEPALNNGCAVPAVVTIDVRFRVDRAGGGAVPHVEIVGHTVAPNPWLHILPISCFPQAAQHAGERGEQYPDPDEFVPVEWEAAWNPTDLQNAVRYPALARTMGLEGRVILQVLIDSKGNPVAVRIMKSDNTLFNDAAVQAVLGTPFKPARNGDRPLATWSLIPIDFRMR